MVCEKNLLPPIQTTEDWISFHLAHEGLPGGMRKIKYMVREKECKEEKKNISYAKYSVSDL